MPRTGVVSGLPRNRSLAAAAPAFLLLILRRGQVFTSRLDVVRRSYRHLSPISQTVGAINDDIFSRLEPRQDRSTLSVCIVQGAGGRALYTRKSRPPKAPPAARSQSGLRRVVSMNNSGGAGHGDGRPSDTGGLCHHDAVRDNQTGGYRNERGSHYALPVRFLKAAHQAKPSEINRAGWREGRGGGSKRAG